LHRSGAASEPTRCLANGVGAGGVAPLRLPNDAKQGRREPLAASSCWPVSVCAKTAAVLPADSTRPEPRGRVSAHGWAYLKTRCLTIKSTSVAVAAGTVPQQE
jgi:hypothetical protein